MLVRKFSSWTYTSKQTNKPSKFVVDDAIDYKEVRPAIAEFHVSEAYPANVQQARAEEYCKYMNRIAEATANAYSENLLADKLKGAV